MQDTCDQVRPVSADNYAKIFTVGSIGLSSNPSESRAILVADSLRPELGVVFPDVKKPHCGKPMRFSRSM